MVRVKTVLYLLCIKEPPFGHHPKNYPVPLLQHYAEVQLFYGENEDGVLPVLVRKELLFGYP